MWCKINRGGVFCPSCGAQITNNPIDQANPISQPVNPNIIQDSPANQIPVRPDQIPEPLIDNQQAQPTIPSANVANSTSNDNTLLEIFIGKNVSKITKAGISWPSFFLGPVYLLYRKMYLYGIAVWVILAISSMFLPSFVSIIYFAIGAAIGIKFNAYYMKHAQEQIAKIKRENSSISHEQLVLMCSKKGGTSIIATLLPGVLFFAIIVIMVILQLSSSGPKLVCESPEGNITIHYNDETITSYQSEGMIFDFDEQRELANRTGITYYINEFSSWFRNNTSGTCRIEDAEDN